MKIFKLKKRDHVNNMHTQKPLDHFKTKTSKISKTLKSTKFKNFKNFKDYA